MSVIHLQPHQPPLEPSTARQLTDSIKTDVDNLWHKLLGAYERDVHTALGYPSWHAYCKAEFGSGKSQSYRLLDAGRVAKAIETQSPDGERRPSEAQARKLAPILKEKGEEAVAHVWREAIDTHGPDPTGEQVEEVARAMGDLEPEPEPEPVPKAKTPSKVGRQQKEFRNALNALELGAEYVRNVLAFRSDEERARVQDLLDVDNETWQEWQRQASVIYLAGSQLRRAFNRKGGRRP